ncbi:MAG: OB-fold nucleic acid binding domain-containing protein, partial [Crocinitomicaceae bacterium]
MKRWRISELLGQEGQALLNKEIEVKGWVRAFRSNRFIQLNDGSCMASIQAVVDFEKFDEALLKRVNTAAALSLTGVLVASQGSGQAIELQVSAIEILGDAHPDDVQRTVMQPKRHSLDFLREQAHLRFRTHTFGAVFRLRHA